MKGLTRKLKCRKFKGELLEKEDLKDLVIKALLSKKTEYLEDMEETEEELQSVKRKRKL